MYFVFGTRGKKMHAEHEILSQLPAWQFLMLFFYFYQMHILLLCLCIEGLILGSA
jgi:hypothetical protein